MKKHLRKIFLSFITILILAFNFQDNYVFYGWQKQTTPNLDGRNLTDVFFLDSLNGWGVTEYENSNDTAFVIRTTNSGDNWQTIYTATNKFIGCKKVKFVNQNTGYAIGILQTPSSFICKTTDGGFNWVQLNFPVVVELFDMQVLDENNIWVASERNNFEGGGIYRTTNGGTNWVRQYNSYASVIRMYNATTGFFAYNSNPGSIYKTTNGGTNWNVILNGEGMMDMVFADSLTMWKAYGDTIKISTNGGIYWARQNKLNPHSDASFTGVKKIVMINRDTLWASGNSIYYIQGAKSRGFFYKTTNGGQSWGYQIPDTSFQITSMPFLQFTDNKKGWAYSIVKNGVHTTIGGDTSTTYPTAISYNGTNLPKDFILYQNYPNPFNPNTVISYQLTVAEYITLKVYDLNGKEITTLINKKQNAGNYTINFDASKYNLSSGIYFYTLTTKDFTNTKKMILVK